MAKKFYAVKTGKKPGVYDTWTECQNQIHGFSGAVYKGFATKEEAMAFIGESGGKREKHKETEAVAYVDGSYDRATNTFSYGVVFFCHGQELHFSKKYADNLLTEMNNVAGEIKGAEAAIQYCLDNNISGVTIYHDYEGIAKWCNGEWKAKKAGTIAYANFYKEAISRVRIQFVKVKGHSGDKYNELADKLAKEALGIKSSDNTDREEKKMAKKGVFIDRDNILELIRNVGNRHWANFKADELIAAGNAQRCVMLADGREAMLNLFFNNDGTTTITPTGKNTEISSVIKALLEEQCKYSGSEQGKTYSIRKIPGEWAENLIKYLSSLENVTAEEYGTDTVPVHRTCVFTSKIGDKLTVNIYQTGTLTLQGKPAYLFSEAIAFLSYCNDVSVDDIINSINSFHDVSIKTSEVRNDMEVLMPRAYGNIDETILKLLSPSVSLRKVNIDLEDYSCYAFPALRALEGYIKYLFGLKGIAIGYTFHKIFKGDVLISSIADQIADAEFQRELERLYAYFRGNRHVIFHTEQILIGTKMIEDKHEADEIINMVFHLIESSYVNICK